MEHKHIDGTKPKSLSDAIVAKIRTDKIAMRPRLYFTLQLLLVTVIALLILLLSVFIFNFILFSIRINSHDAFLSFGPRGIEAFLMFFPWPFLIADIAFIALLDWLLRTFKFAYRTPMLYLLGGILIVTVAAGLAIDRGTPFNDRLLDRAGEHRLPPPLSLLYGAVRRPPHDGICRCTITAIGTSTITVQDFRGGSTTTFEVLLPQDDARATTTGLHIGDTVLVAGDRDGDGDDVIRAFGVRKAGEWRHGTPGSHEEMK